MSDDTRARRGGGDELDPQTVLAVLKSGDFDELLGNYEGQEVEFKSEPYAVAAKGGKFELAKDVSSFANASGGLLTIGVGTREETTHSRDKVSEVHGIRTSDANKDTYEKIIRDWIYPRLENFSVSWYGKGETHGFLTIHIPPQAAHRQPFLVNRTPKAKGMSSIFFGYYERSHDDTTHRDVEEIHSQLVRGRDVDSWKGDLQDIQRTLAGMLNGGGPEPHDPIPGARVHAAREAAALHDEATFALTAKPCTPVEVDLFSSESRALGYIKDPPRLRRAGFELWVHGAPEIVLGKSRRISRSGRVIELYSDGMLIFANEGDERGLCRKGLVRWPPGNALLHINPVVLIERTYLFVRLFRQIAATVELSRAEYSIQFLDMETAQRQVYLGPGPVDALGWKELRKRIPDPSKVIAVDGDPTAEEPERLACRLLEKVYVEFGWEHEKIPYTVKREDGVRVVDLDVLRKLG